MTTEWDNTPWAGSVVKSTALTKWNTPLTVKAVTGAGVTAYANDYPLSSLRQDPQQRSEAFLRAYKCGWFYKAESKISGDLATLPWTVTDGDIESDDPRETEIGRPDLDVPIEQLNPIEQFMRLMERPNPRQTGRQLRQKTFIRRDMAGVAFWYLEAAGPLAPVSAIYGISPSRLWPAYDKQKQLIGYVLDYNAPGGGTPFETWEIVPFSNSSADDDDIFGVGVVEAVYAELPLTDFLTRHTADLLSTGGRLAGMLWPKERALNEDEFTDAQRAWRNVVSDPASARRLLLFPEPMEWAPGASTPAEIGIPELAELNRDNILTAFPISPYMLGVPTPGGLNSGEVRKEDRRDYWESTIAPRASSFDEIVQTNIISRYEALMGQTFRYESDLPRLDDATALLEKAGALRSLIAIGFDPKDTIKAVGLDHIKWTKLPDQLDPNKPPEPTATPGGGSGLTSTVGDSNRQDAAQTNQSVVSKGIKSRAVLADASVGRLQGFLHDQRERISERIRARFPTRVEKESKALREDVLVKSHDWWDPREEDAFLRQVLYALYLDASRHSLQSVADILNRIIPNKAVDRIQYDLAVYGGERISDINARTLEALVIELAEGTKRGYSIPQLIDGVPEEGYGGVKGVELENGIPVFGDARAETIARTETALSYNRAALDAYKEFNVGTVLAYDGDYDEECAARNGQEFPIEEALGIEDHPNGTLDWAPVVDKAAHAATHRDHMPELIAALKVQPPVNINNFIEPAKAADVTVEAPVINVTTPEVIVPPAQVNVTVEDHSERVAEAIKATPPVINNFVEQAPTPNVQVDAPVVNVSVPERSVNIEPPPPAAIQVDVHVPESKPRKKTVERDDKGLITGVTETDGD